MNSTAEPVGTINVALAHAVRLLERDPALAAQQALEILKTAPAHPHATLLLAVARRAGGEPGTAQELLTGLIAGQPHWGLAYYELGVTLGVLGQGEAAVAALRRAVDLNCDFPNAWRALADHLDAMGDEGAAQVARARLLKASVKDPRLMSAAAALCEGQVAHAETLLREHLLQHPTDIAAIRMLAEIATRLSRYRDAESLLTRCLELAPDFLPARHNLAAVLFRQAKSLEALPEVERLLRAEPRNPGYRSLKATILGGLGDYAGAIALYGEVLREYPHQAKIWLSYGHALKTAGRTAEGISAYRRTIELQPGMGEAWWSLANLKTFRFEAADLDVMRAQLTVPELQTEDRYHFHFALGKALEDAGQYADSFEHYRQGNTLRRGEIYYDARKNGEHTARSCQLFTREFFAARSGYGVPAADPIFIVGLPRAGSTLLEQILSSHSLVEGTMELPDVAIIARALIGATTHGAEPRYPEALAELPAGKFQEFAEQYLRHTRVQRKSAAPFFIDKMPNNFAHLGLIHLMFPRARIIDARRHPLGCCLSGFKQHFARGQNFTYDLSELGEYYRDYVRLMAHFDSVLPGRIHRVHYERMVTDTEHEVRRLLEYCGLEFEPACLRFYENERAVRTASSEQVRTPIFREGVDQWRHYESWLGPLEAALGPVLAAYPQVPDFP